MTRQLRQRCEVVCLVCTSLITLIATPASAQQRWPGFLGAGHSAIAAESVPVKWSPTENLAWAIATPGYGQSSPVIWDDHVYVTSVDGVDKETLHVICCSLQTGKVLWESTHQSTYPERSSVYISRAAPTPVVDQEGIYAYFESGDIVSLAHDGQARWAVSLKERNGAPQNEYGLAASPVQLPDRLIILVDDEGPSYLTALSKLDGSELWKAERTSRKSWSSPMLVPCVGSLQVVCSSGGSVDGYDPQTGEQLWSFKDVGGNSNTTPTVVSESEILISASPGREGENADLAKKSNGLFVINREGDDWNPRFAWTNPASTPSWGSPIVHQAFAYWVNRVGVVFCLDVRSGQIAYTERIKQPCWATPVGLGNSVYIFGKDGLTTVLSAGEEFKVIAENTLWAEDKLPVNNTPTVEEDTEERRRAMAMFSKPTVYGVAMVNGYIVLRTGSQIFCIHEPVVAINDMNTQ